MRFARFGIAALLLATSPVLAQEISSVPEHLLAMVGDWRLEQEDQTLPTCSLVFTDQQTTGGWGIAVPEVCPAPFPPAEALFAWNVDAETGDVLLIDEQRRLTMRLLEDEDGLYVTPEGQLPAFYLMLPWDADGTGGEAGDSF